MMISTYFLFFCNCSDFFAISFCVMRYIQRHPSPNAMIVHNNTFIKSSFLRMIFVHDTKHFYFLYATKTRKKSASNPNCIFSSVCLKSYNSVFIPEVRSMISKTSAPQSKVTKEPSLDIGFP